MATPFLSIITINYNQAEGLLKTIESVVQQTFKDYEFLIVDGGSTDGSLEVIKEFENHIDYSESKSDRGIYHAMNKGIAKAKGTYLLFLNSGDFLTSAAALKSFMEHPQFDGDIVYGDYQFAEGHKVYPDSLTPTYFMRTSLPHQSTFFHRKVFDLLGGYDESYPMGADRAFYIKAFLDGRFHFKHIPYFLTEFDLSGVSNYQEFKKKKQAEDQRLLKESYGEYYEHYWAIHESEMHQSRVPKYSPKGIWKRIKKRWRQLWNH
ncbi:MAG TPA: glycosyltransferase family 2 protein [Flavobacteriaceae bacterium]|nr:glycosyltransferase family 2 protein [Flavobacteriaceae bacterium]